jgi:hypothetical protein
VTPARYGWQIKFPAKTTEDVRWTGLGNINFINVLAERLVWV